MVREPPITRFDMGQEIKSVLGSIKVTWAVLFEYMRIYFAAVAPP